MAVSKGNFFKDHYDWLVALVGVASLAGVGFLYVTSQGNTPEAARAACEAELKASNRPASGEVPSAEADIALLTSVEGGFKNPKALDAASDVDGSFLLSEYRVRCVKCRKPIPFKSLVCSWCNFEQPSEKPEEVERKGADLDGDGMTDAWERRYGFDPNNRADGDQDADGDLFTNLEEFKAETNPKDAEDHPDYLDDLALASALDTKTLPFWISDVTPMAGNNYRVWFNVTDPKYDNKKVSAVKGEEVAFMLKGAKWNAKPEKSGWRIVKIDKKTRKFQKAGAGQEMTKDEFIIDLERISDKTVKSVPWKVKAFPIEEQIDLRWNRGDGKTFTVAAGTEFELNKRKYKVVELKKSGVTIFDQKAERRRTVGDKVANQKPEAKPTAPSASKNGLNAQSKTGSKK